MQGPIHHVPNSLKYLKRIQTFTLVLSDKYQSQRAKIASRGSLSMAMSQIMVGQVACWQTAALMLSLTLVLQGIRHPSGSNFSGNTNQN
jgi:hypothetical protein